MEFVSESIFKACQGSAPSYKKHYFVVKNTAQTPSYQMLTQLIFHIQNL